MLQRILVPIDASEAAEATLRAVENVLAVERPQVLLFSVLERRGADEPPELSALLEGLEPYRERLARHGASVSVLGDVGDPAERILAQVEESRPDLVVMGTHGRMGLERVVRGSVAESVLRQCTAPLLLVNPRAAGAGAAGWNVERILVPVDGSEVADGILPLVAQVASWTNALIVLLRIVEPPAAFPELSDVPTPAELTASLEQRRTWLEQQGARATVLADMDQPVEAILRHAEQADLVAMSTHGRSGLSRWWFGSVAEQVLRQVQLPVLVRRASP